MAGGALCDKPTISEASNTTGTWANTTMSISDAGIQRAADKFIVRKEEANLSSIIDHAVLKNNDFKISSSRYIHTSDAETYRPIGEIVEELKVIEAEAVETDKALKEILEKIGVGA
ncbi:MAG: hypothetical protein Tsb0027_06060 [Wenzhouxiangellaceae bacterium]